MSYFAAAMFQTEYFIAGIAPFPEGRIVLLTYNESEVKMEVSYPLSNWKVVPGQVSADECRFLY